MAPQLNFVAPPRAVRALCITKYVTAVAAVRSQREHLTEGRTGTLSGAPQLNFVSTKYVAPQLNEVGFNAEFQYQNKKLSYYGRPGWHIECSTMINETLGDHFDIHLGGIDLKFPHHYNENVQANAFHHPKFLKQKWCDEFRHTGHLCIDGLKMSKSLKNFTTIEEILKTTNRNVLRWLFMKYKWTEPMNYSDDTLKEANHIDTQITQLWNKVQHYRFERTDIKYGQKKKELEESIFKIRKEMEIHLENLSFELFVSDIMEYIKRMNIYLGLENWNESLIKDNIDYLRRWLDVLGFEYFTLH